MYLVKQRSVLVGIVVNIWVFCALLAGDLAVILMSIVADYVIYSLLG